MNNLRRYSHYISPLVGVDVDIDVEADVGRRRRGRGRMFILYEYAITKLKCASSTTSRS